MNKDYASMILGIMGLGVVFFIGQTAYVSTVCALVAIVFGLLARREEGYRKGYILTGFITGGLTLVLLILNNFIL